MKAIYYDRFGGPLELRELPDPEVPRDGVVIRVEASGVCRSDWHGWMGHDPDVRLPHVPGHEFAGVVEEAGKDVTKWKRGDRVTVPFSCGCGDCPQCDAGFQNICDHYFQPGFTHWGSFASLVSIKYADTNLVRLPETIDFITAASLGCRFITSFRAVVDQGKVKPGQWVAVFGCGGVGLSAIQIAAAHGARVVAIDIDDEKLDLARSIGACETVNAKRDGGGGSSARGAMSASREGDSGDGGDEAAKAVNAKRGGGDGGEDSASSAANARHDGGDAAAKALNSSRDSGGGNEASPGNAASDTIIDLTNGGAHLSIDALGSVETCTQSVRSLRKRGRHVQVGVMAGDQSAPPIPMGMVMSRELELVGSHGMQAHRYDAVLQMVLSGKLDPGKLVSRTISLAELPAEMERMGRYEGVGIAVIDRLSI